MPGMIMIISPTGKTSCRHVEKPIYKEIREALGGPLEIVAYFTTLNGKRCVAFTHEEGKIEGLPPNPTANRLWREARDTAGVRGSIDDYLVGPIVVLMGDDDFMEMV